MSALPKIPARLPRGHKGTFGTVAVLGGMSHHASEEGPGSVMVGGPAFAAIAALRAGCGLVRLAMPEPVLASGLVVAPSATGVALAVDAAGDLVPHLASEAIDELVAGSRCLVVGPGLGQSDGAEAATLRAFLQETAALVADADALNNLARVPSFHLEMRASAVLTPHVGEFRRLAQPLGITDDPAEESTREAACVALAQRLGCVVVLKSAATVVSDGISAWTHDRPNPALATGGSGDVLAGIIGGLISQFFRAELARMNDEQRALAGALTLYDCARLGVAVHARAAAAWSARTGVSAGMLATDLLAEIPAEIEALRG